MLEQLQAHKGKNIVIELVNGRKISGTVLSADQKFLRMETDEGIGTISVKAVQITWGKMDRSLPGEHMEHIAGQLRDSVKAQISCTAFPGFTCSQSYICRPPDNCTFSFACPGSYVPSFPSGGGGCPQFFCGSFQFQQPCGSFTFQQPCGPITFGCGSFQFQQPCGPFTFQQPCEPFTFGCGSFQFGGSQCGTLGGFACPGMQFAGAPVRPPRG